MTSSKAVKHRAAISLLMLIVSASTGDSEVIGANRVRRSDDVTFESLQALVMQQAAVIQTLQAKVAALENTSQVQGNSLGTLNNNLQVQGKTLGALNNTLQVQGHSLGTLTHKVQVQGRSLGALQTNVDTNAKTVAFSARMSQDAAALPMTPGQTLIFDNAISNVGNAYHSHTGIFTAPVAGTYVFFLSATSTHNHPSIQLVISKNGAKLDRVYAEGTSDIGDQGSSLVSTHLVKGDQVSVHQMKGDAIRGGYWTVFTGYLLQAQ